MSKLKEIWERAGANPGVPQPLGNIVVCDVCDADYTDSEDSGGFIFGSTSYCPQCAPKGMRSVKKYNEERFIRAICPPGKSFADFVREYRGPGAAITIHIGK